MLAQVSYDVDVPYVSKLQSTPLRCPLFVLCGCFLSRSVLIGPACKTTSSCTSTGGQASTLVNAVCRNRYQAWQDTVRGLQKIVRDDVETNIQVLDAGEVRPVACACW